MTTQISSSSLFGSKPKVNKSPAVFSSFRFSFGLIFGRSGSGKTNLLQLMGELSKPTSTSICIQRSGSICIQRYGDDGHPNQSPEQLQYGRVVVFQFPERELASLVDHSWRMEMGEVLKSEFLPF